MDNFSRNDNSDPGGSNSNDVNSGDNANSDPPQIEITENLFLGTHASNPSTNSHVRPASILGARQTPESIDRQYHSIQQRLLTNTPGARPIEIRQGQLRMAHLLNDVTQKTEPSGLNRFLSVSCRKTQLENRTSNKCKQLEKHVEKQYEEEGKDGEKESSDSELPSEMNGGDMNELRSENSSSNGKNDPQELNHGNEELSPSDDIKRKVTKHSSGSKAESDVADSPSPGYGKGDMISAMMNETWSQQELDRIRDFAHRWDPCNRRKKKRKKLSKSRDKMKIDGKGTDNLNFEPQHVDETGAEPGAETLTRASTGSEAEAESGDVA